MTLSISAWDTVLYTELYIEGVWWYTVLYHQAPSKASQSRLPCPIGQGRFQASASC
jgi:hypothetical protein